MPYCRFISIFFDMDLVVNVSVMGLLIEYIKRDTFLPKPFVA